VGAFAELSPIDLLQVCPGQVVHEVNFMGILVWGERFLHVELKPGRQVCIRLTRCVLTAHDERVWLSELCEVLVDRGVRADHRGDVLRFGPAPYLIDDQIWTSLEALGEVLR